MSKKELLDRITGPRGPEAKATTVTRRAEGPPVAAPVVAPPPVGADPGTTRVSKNVVRRRRADSDGPEEVAPSPTTVIRRRPADVGAVGAPPPARREPPPAAARSRSPEAGEPTSAAPVAHPEPSPEPEVAAPARVEAPEPAPVVVEAPPAPAPEPAPRAAAPKVEAKPSAPKAEPPRAEPPRGEAPREPSRLPERPPRPAIPDGLGKAVVALPPGYDPTARRRPATPPPGGRPGPMGGQGRPGDRPGPRRPEGGGGGRPGPHGPHGGPHGPSMQQQPQAPSFDPGYGGGDSDRQRRSRAAQGVDLNALRRRPARRKGGLAPRAVTEKKASKRKIRIDNVISVGQLAHELGVKASVVIKELMGLGKMVTVNEILDLETAQIVASNFEYEVVDAGFQEEQFLQQVAADADEEGSLPRAPVVTIMGHVDHGKTTLLDAIRSAKVAAGEAGGITQHIGAYQVEARDQKITFIDTPGHAAFTAMRARGAKVTDVVVLVVASDDGVQAQTEEAIAHAKAADVPIVVAVNKMDKPGANADPIKQKLSELGLVPEDWGGDTMFVPVSALKKQGIDELLEAILLQSEVLELAANPDRHAEGTVLEAKVVRGRGPVATLLVTKGTLKRGDNIVLGSSFGRVRAMLDHTGKQLKEAGPATPVEIFGIDELPDSGDSFVVVKSEKDGRAIAEHRAREKRDAQLAQTNRRTAADLFAAAERIEKKVLPIILRCDVSGSLEALKLALGQISVDGTELRILQAFVGDITESDINLAAANGASVFGFNVKMDAMARQAADQQNVTPEFFDVIYGLIDKVTAMMGGLLGPQYREVRLGEVEVKAIFQISKVGKIAGCYITDGKVIRGSIVRVVRNGKVVHEGKISTLKRFKEDVREVTSGYECGIGLDGWEEMEAGDFLEVYGREEVKFVNPSSADRR